MDVCGRRHIGEPAGLRQAESAARFNTLFGLGGCMVCAPRIDHQFTRRVRTAYGILVDGFDVEPGVVGEVFGGTVERLGDLQQAEHNLHEDAWAADESDPDRRFRSLLALYQLTYERFYPTLCAPFVVAGGIHAGETRPAGGVGGDGRVKLRVIQDMEVGRGIADQAVTAGLDNHLGIASHMPISTS